MYSSSGRERDAIGIGRENIVQHSEHMSPESLHVLEKVGDSMMSHLLGSVADVVGIEAAGVGVTIKADCRHFGYMMVRFLSRVVEC